MTESKLTRNQKFCYQRFLKTSSVSLSSCWRREMYSVQPVTDCRFTDFERDLRQIDCWIIPRNPLFFSYPGFSVHSRIRFTSIPSVTFYYRDILLLAYWLPATLIWIYKEGQLILSVVDSFVNISPRIILHTKCFHLFCNSLCGFIIIVS